MRTGWTKAENLSCYCNLLMPDDPLRLSRSPEFFGLEFQKNSKKFPKDLQKFCRNFAKIFQKISFSAIFWNFIDFQKISVKFLQNFWKISNLMTKISWKFLQNFFKILGKFLEIEPIDSFKKHLSSKFQRFFLT